jgi:glutaredoxin
MKLFTTKDCEPCERIKKYIKEQGLEVDAVEVIKKEDGSYEVEGKPFDAKGRAFPMLLLQRGIDSVLLCGEEGVQQILDVGYIYKNKTCPYFKERCKHSECAKFVVLYRGAIPEGACSDWWNPMLSLELISLTQELKKVNPIDGGK